MWLDLVFILSVFISWSFFCVGWYNIESVDWCVFTVCGYCARVDVVSVGLAAFRGLSTFWFSVSGL